MSQSVTLVILEPGADTDPRDATIRCLLAEIRLLRSALGATARREVGESIDQGFLLAG